MQAKECNDIDECNQEYATPGFPDFSEESFCTIEIVSVDAGKCVEIDFTSFEVERLFLIDRKDDKISTDCRL